MIIVEGPDGAGKTSLVARLSVALGLEPEPRRVGTDTQPLVQIDQWVERDLYSWPRPALYDRHALISEPIYGPILRANNMRAGFDDWSWLQHKLHLFNRAKPFIIFCLPPLSVVTENVLIGETDNKAVEEHIAEIYQLYCMEAARRADSLVWDYTAETAGQTYGLVKNSLRNRLATLKERGVWG